MNHNSWIIPGIITSCKHKRELYKELQNNTNATLASYYRDYSKILSMVIGRTEIIEHDKLILNSHNKVKTKLKLNSVDLVCERTIPTERPPPVGEVSANFCG